MRAHFGIRTGISTAMVVLGATFFAMQLRTSLAQDAPAAAAPAPLSAAATRGKAVFQEKCALCHNAESAEKKIGPGMKGLYQRGTFTGDGSKVTDESVKKFIEAGKGMMPPFKETLEPAKLDDVVAYVKTL